MPKESRPRKGSLQFYPRKRAEKFLHRVNWKPVYENSKQEGLLGFIAYKAGMATAIVKDNTPKVTSSGKQIHIPVTILEIPNMKIFSIRFYKNNNVIKEIIVANDKELKRVLRIPKVLKKLGDNTPKNYDDIKVIAYSLAKQTLIKKTPDLIELAINSSDKLSYVKNLIGKEISLSELKGLSLVDVRGLTKGKGTQGPVKRFGIKLRQHKSEKGVRRPGSLAPWHPAHVTFRAPMAGQLGLFSRVIYNLKNIHSGKISEKDINPSSGFKNYGKIKTSYLIITGSIQGPAKRAVVVTQASRPSKLQSKKKFEFLGLIQ